MYAATALVVPLQSRTLLDRIDRKESVGFLIVQLVVLMAVGALLILSQGIILGQLGERVIMEVRMRMTSRIVRLRTSSLSKYAAGELVSRVTSDTMLLREATTTGIAQVARSTVTIIGALAFMFALDPIMIVTTAVCLGVIVVGVGILMPRLSNANELAQDAMGNVGGRLESIVRAIRTVKASRAESREDTRLFTFIQISMKQGTRAARIQSAVAMVASVGGQLAFLAILGVGALRVSNGDLTVSTMIAFLLYIGLLTEPISTFADSMSQTQQALAAASRIQEIDRLEMEQDIENPVRPVPGTDSAVIKFDKVSATYTPGSNLVLRDIRLSISRHGHTAFVGPSGAGKTTMFSLLLRFIDPERGKILMDGVPLSRWALEALRERVVYVEQEAPLLPGTVRENVAYTSLDTTEDDIWHALRLVRLERKVQSLEAGLDTTLVNTILSGGERQRIALARAIAAKPEVLLLDEATSQLDGVTEAVIHDCIKSISKRGAVLTIAHRLSTVIDADQIVVMEHGQVRAMGTHEQLLATDKLYKDLIAALRIGTTVGPAPAPPPPLPAPRNQTRSQGVKTGSEFPRHVGRLWPTSGFTWFGRRAGKHARAEGQVTWMDGVYQTVPDQLLPQVAPKTFGYEPPQDNENGFKMLRRDEQR
jgi:ATP-binding cassette subfamily B protein